MLAHLHLRIEKTFKMELSGENLACLLAQFTIRRARRACWLRKEPCNARIWAYLPPSLPPSQTVTERREDKQVIHRQKGTCQIFSEGRFVISTATRSRVNARFPGVRAPTIFEIECLLLLLRGPLPDTIYAAVTTTSLNLRLDIAKSRLKHLDMFRDGQVSGWITSHRTRRVSLSFRRCFYLLLIFFLSISNRPLVHRISYLLASMGFRNQIF